MEEKIERLLKLYKPFAIKFNSFGVVCTVHREGVPNEAGQVVGIVLHQENPSLERLIFPVCFLIGKKRENGQIVTRFLDDFEKAFLDALKSVLERMHEKDIDEALRLAKE